MPWLKVPVPATLRQEPAEFLKQPSVNARPLLKVEVALDSKVMFPPVIVSPPCEASPAVPVAVIPERNVEVAPSPPTLITF